jgi:hypothetical protein
MVINPVTLAIIEQGIKLGSEAIGAYKNRKLHKKELKEEKKQTKADLLNSIRNKSIESEAEGIRSSHNLSKKRSEALRNTAATVRGSLR